MRILIPFSPTLSALYLLGMLMGLYQACSPEKETEVSISTDSLTLAALQEQIAKNRNDHKLYFQRAQLYFKKKEYSHAIADMHIAIKIDSTRPSYHTFLADLYFTQNQTRLTRDHLRKAIALDSTFTEALFKYSQLYYYFRKYDTALFYVNRCLRYSPLHTTAFFLKGMILKEAGDSARAIESFQRAAEIDPQYYDAWMQLGILYSKRKNKLALEYFHNALLLQPNNPEVHYARAKFLQDIGEYEKALAAYDTLLALSPHHLDAIFNKGAIYFEQKAYEKAKEQFEQAILHDLNYFRAYYGRGLYYEVMGRKQRALAEYQRCLAIQPDFEPAKQRIQVLEQKRK